MVGCCVWSKAFLQEIQKWNKNVSTEKIILTIAQATPIFLSVFYLANITVNLYLFFYSNQLFQNRLIVFSSQKMGVQIREFLSQDFQKLRYRGFSYAHIIWYMPIIYNYMVITFGLNNFLQEAASYIILFLILPFSYIENLNI